jgi:hypothetical protein
MRLLRSLARIVTAVVVLTGVGFAALALVLRQPVLSPLPFHAKARADAATLRKHVDFLTKDVRPRRAKNPENLVRTAEYIAKHFRAAGGNPQLQWVRDSPNVIAQWGPKNDQPPLIIGAHYDAFGETGELPGADDNASGTAGLLEIARLLQGQSLQVPVILVAYTNEEPPYFGSALMGSAMHANSLNGSIRGMICLEMIGYYSDRQTWPSPIFAWIYPDHGRFVAITAGWDDRQLTRHVKRAMRGAGGIDVLSFTGSRQTSDASDQRNYWARGWPAVMITDTAFLRNPHYHTAGDTAETLDYTRMARVRRRLQCRAARALTAVLHARLAERTSARLHFRFDLRQRASRAFAGLAIHESRHEEMPQHGHIAQRFGDEDLAIALIDCLHEDVRTHLDRRDRAERRRHLAQHVVEARQLALRVAHEIGIDPRRMRDADVHALVHQFEAQSVAELLDARFRRAIRGHPSRRGDGGGRGDEEVVAFGGGDVRQRRVHRANDAHEIHGHHALQHFDRRDGHGAVRSDPGVGDDDVDAAECAHRPFDGARERRLIGDVAVEPDVLRTELACEIRQALRLESGKRHPVAAGRERTGKRGADAARGAGDENSHARKDTPEHPAPISVVLEGRISGPGSKTITPHRN